jgi:hypothetical protein
MQTESELPESALAKLENVLAEPNLSKQPISRNHPFTLPQMSFSPQSTN